MTSQPTRSVQADSACRKVLVDLESRGEACVGAPLRFSRFRYNPGTKAIALFLLLTCIALPGCSLCQNAKRTICDEPSEYWWFADRKRSVKVYRSWADRAWCQHGISECGQGISSAYEVGFKDGFVDYVFAGGSGEPPPVPPRQFWNVGHRKPRGHAEADQWFAGFRHGAQVAHNEGYREQTIVPASVFFGPKEGCWEDQPCCEQPYLAPIPQPRTPELLPPGQLEPRKQSEEFSPLLPSAEQGNDRGPDVPIPAEEEMPIPGGKVEQPQTPPMPELSPAPDKAPEPSPGLKPTPTPEPERSIDDIFNEPASDLTTEKPDRRVRSKLTTRKLTDPEVQQARAAFSAAIRRPRKSGLSASKSAAHSRVQPLHRVRSFQPATISSSDDRAEEMFRRLSK